MNEIKATNNQIVFLGNKGIERHLADGTMRCIEVNVQLSYRNNHFWCLEKDNKATYMMTAEGYEYLNKFAGLKVIKEDTFVLNGQEFTNPAIIVDSTGRKTEVYYKTTLGGYAPDGTYTLSTTIIHYNVTDELISEILKKIRYTKADEKDPIGFLCPKHAFEEYRKSNPFSLFIETDNFGGEVLGVCVNTKHRDFSAVRQTHQEKVLNIEKKIQTVGKRNAYKKHPATAIYTLKPEVLCDEKGNKLDLVYNEKVVMWIKDGEEPEIDIKNAVVTVEEFKDVDPDYEVSQDEGNPFEEDVTIIDALSEDVEEVKEIEQEDEQKLQDAEELAKELEEKRQVLITKIEKLSKTSTVKPPQKFKMFSFEKLDELLTKMLDAEV